LKTKSYKIQRLEFISEKLRVEIVRRRLCASVLVVSRGKTALVRALPGRRPWLDFELHGRPWGSSPERRERGKGRGRGGGCWGCYWRLRAQWGWGLLGCAMVWAAPCCQLVRDCSLYMREESRKEKRRERKEKKGRKKRKGKNGKFFQTWKFPKRKI
jgi:hypothetical protein